MSSSSKSSYLCFIGALDFDTNQVQVFVIESLVDLAVLALLPAASLPLSLFVFLFLIDDESRTFLLYY